MSLLVRHRDAHVLSGRCHGKPGHRQFCGMNGRLAARACRTDGSVRHHGRAAIIIEDPLHRPRLPGFGAAASHLPGASDHQDLRRPHEQQRLPRGMFRDRCDSVHRRRERGGPARPADRAGGAKTATSSSPRTSTPTTGWRSRTVAEVTRDLPPPRTPSTPIRCPCGPTGSWPTARPSRSGTSSSTSSTCGPHPRVGRAGADRWPTGGCTSSRATPCFPAASGKTGDAEAFASLLDGVEIQALRPLRRRHGRSTPATATTPRSAWSGRSSRSGAGGGGSPHPSP